MVALTAELDYKLETLSGHNRFYEEPNGFLPPENHKQSIAYRCSRCARIYREGSHVEHMSGVIHQLLER